MISFNTKSFVSIAFCVSLVFSYSASAKTHPYDAKFESKIRALMYEGNQVSQSKVNAYLGQLLQKRLEVVGLTADGQMANNSILITKYSKDSLTKAELKKKLEESEMNMAFNYAIAQVRSIKPSSSYTDVLSASYNALDIESAVRIEGAMTIFDLISGILDAITNSWKVSKTSTAQEEATNLFDQRSGSFLSAQDIASLKLKNTDLSLYNPAQSTFWQAQADVSKVDVRKAAIGENLDLYKDTKVEFPLDNTFYMEEVKHSDTKPKVDAYAKRADGKKNKFKLKFGGEIHADPIVSSLMMTLGYPTDVSRYARNIKLVIGKLSNEDVDKLLAKKAITKEQALAFKQSPQARHEFLVSRFTRDWEVYYRRENTRNKYLIENEILNSGTMSDGQSYVVFKEGLIEAKPRKIERFGPWAFSEHSFLREVRALSLVQIWLDNTDTPDFLNNRLLLKKNDSGFQKFHVISDPGKSLGSIFGSMPEAYSWKVVSKNSENEIALSYLSIANGIKGKITYADARWAIRLIAGLTRAQIATAVQLGGFSQCIADNYVNRAISRRNDLVENFGLLGERLSNGQTIQLLPVDMSIRELGFDGSCNKKSLKAEHTANFDFNFGFLVSPLLESTRNLILDSARGAISSLERVTIKSDRFTTNLKGVAEIIIDPKREIEKNMNPKSAEDQYIVKEYLRIGFRYGVAYGAYIDNTYTIAFSLAFPVRSLEEARLKKGFVVNALLPRDILKNDLPASYVLMTEHSFEYGAGVNFDQKVAPSPFSLKAGAGEVTLHRSILDHRDANNAVFYRENSKFDRKSVEAFLGISILKIPIFNSFNDTDGRATGRGFVLAPEQMKAREGQLLKAIVNADFSDFKDLEKNFDLRNRFSSKTRNWNLIFIKSSSDKRLDNIIFDQADQSKSYIQYRISRSRSRALFSNVETRKVNVEVYTNPNEADKFQINLSVIGMDKNTLDKELDLDYLGFINGLAVNNESVIPFSPSLKYSTNGRWGDIIMNSDSFYYPAAVERIISVTSNQFWSALASSMKISMSHLETLKVKYVRLQHMVQAAGSGPRSATVNNASLLKSAGLTRQEAEVIDKSNVFLKDLAKVRLEKSLDKKVKKLAELMRRSVFLTPRGFYDSRVLGALNRVAGEDNFFSLNTISTPKFTEVNLIEEVPLRGHVGTKQKTNLDYLVFTPITPADLYYMFDSWF